MDQCLRTRDVLGRDRRTWSELEYPFVKLNARRTRGELTDDQLHGALTNLATAYDRIHTENSERFSENIAPPGTGEDLDPPGDSDETNLSNSLAFQTTADALFRSCRDRLDALRSGTRGDQEYLDAIMSLGSYSQAVRVQDSV